LTTAIFRLADHGDANAVEGSHPSDSHQVEAVEVERDAAGGDFDAVLADDAGNITGQVVRTGLGDLEEAVRVARRVDFVDGNPRLGLGKRFHGWHDRPDRRVQIPGVKPHDGSHDQNNQKGR
jgi:hypothetical protein